MATKKVTLSIDKHQTPAAIANLSTIHVAPSKDLLALKAMDINSSQIQQSNSENLLITVISFPFLFSFFSMCQGGYVHRVTKKQHHPKFNSDHKFV